MICGIKNTINGNNNEINIMDSPDDEGYYYERQLFTHPYENKLKEFNFLQAIMLLDEYAYNLDPIHFHYCFLKLKDPTKFKLIKDNFQSDLLKSLLNDINLSKINEIKNLTFVSKRSLDDEISAERERDVSDVMPHYIRKKSNFK